MLNNLIFKKMYHLRGLAGAVCWLVLGIAALPAQSAHQSLREGDRHYERAKYREAEDAYRKAAEQAPGKPDVQYNTGNAVYQQGNYADAEKLFEEAAKSTRDPNREADALHNLGNAYLKQQKYKEAVDAYEKSLRSRPGDAQTKVNLQLAKKKRQQQQQEEQKKQDQQNKPNPDPQNPPPPPQDQSPPKDQQQQPKQGQQPQQSQPQPEQGGEGKMTREQARRLLETAVGPEDQRNARKYREQEPQKKQAQPKKDW
ncbi:MAG: tetratricopeptide repeat protein [Saprospiraceae bacterium]|nr:tetratricopeptide repeat protein [Saprospiraceae bacterium]